MLKQGPPPKNTRTGKTAQYIGVFVVIGIVLYALVIGFQDTLKNIGGGLFSVAGFVLPQILSWAIFAGLVGAIQAWVLREHLESRNLPRFIGFAVLGGVAGGFVAGIAMNIEHFAYGDNLFIPGLLTGGLVGAIAGAVSSAGQNTLMSSASRKGQWMTYSIVSWLLIWGLGWAISWGIGGIPGSGFGSVLMMIASGIALSVFLSKTAIEF